MHTTELKLKDGSIARVFHNSDWSGDVIIRWTSGEGPKEATIPGVVLLRIGYAAAHEHIKSHLVSVLEQMSTVEP